MFKIYIKKYDHIVVEGTYKQIEIPLNFWEKILANIALFIFSLINWKWTHMKDDKGKLWIGQILDIRGWRTCSHESKGQVYISELLWQIGRIYF